MKKITVMKSYYLVFCAVALSILFSCTKKTRGCTDMNALNYNSSAEESDGSCTYSKITFYAKYGSFNGIPITSIDVSVNNNMIGTITSIYPAGPGNCDAQGTVAFSFSSASSYDWNTVVHLANGATIFGSGTTSPMAGVDCVKVNVTQ